VRRQAVDHSLFNSSGWVGIDIEADHAGEVVDLAALRAPLSNMVLASASNSSKSGLDGFAARFACGFALPVNGITFVYFTTNCFHQR